MSDEEFTKAHFEIHDLCVMCKEQTTLKVCGKCNLSWYCGINCQQAHWKIHKLVCKNHSFTKADALKIQLTTEEMLTIPSMQKSQTITILYDPIKEVNDKITGIEVKGDDRFPNGLMILAIKLPTGIYMVRYLQNDNSIIDNSSDLNRSFTTEKLTNRLNKLVVSSKMHELKSEFDPEKQLLVYFVDEIENFHKFNFKKFQIQTYEKVNLTFSKYGSKQKLEPKCGAFNIAINFNFVDKIKPTSCAVFTFPY